MKPEQYAIEREAAMKRAEEFRENTRSLPNYWQVRYELLAEERIRDLETIRRLRAQVKRLKAESVTA